MTVAYVGDNEFGVVKAVIDELNSVMEDGGFIPSDSPAEKLEFQSAGGTGNTGGSGQVITLNTDRGTESQEEEESYLSKYGVLFVCLVAILGAGFCAAMYVRRRKKQRRVKEMEQEDGGVNLAKTEERCSGSNETDSPGGVRITMNQVELGVPAADSGDSIEISLSEGMTPGYGDVKNL